MVLPAYGDFMDEHSSLESALSRPAGGTLSFVHRTVTDGDAEHASQLHRWDIDVMATVTASGSSPSGRTTIGQVTAVTVLHPRNLDEIERALTAGAAHVTDTFVEAIGTPAAAGSRFREYFMASRAMSGQQDLLIITDVHIQDPFRTVEGLISRIVAGVSSGPAGRNAAYVVLEPSGWDVTPRPCALQGFTVSPAVRELDRAGFEPWANTPMLTHANVAEYTVFDDEPAPAVSTTRTPVGGPHARARTAELWLGDVLDDAKHKDPLRVRFDLPPALNPALAAGIPDNIQRVLADETTGTILIVTDTHTFEVVGRPGNAPQLVGDAAAAPDGTQAWLREIHHRWWTYRTTLKNQADKRVTEVLAGTLQAADPSRPHLTVPPLSQHQVPWPGVGEVELHPTIFETDTTRVLDIVHTIGSRHDTIGRVSIDTTGYIHARIDDERNLNLGDPDIATTHILQLAANTHLAGILHDTLDQQLTATILTGHTAA